MVRWMLLLSGVLGALLVAVTLWGPAREDGTAASTGPAASAPPADPGPVAAPGPTRGSPPAAGPSPAVAPPAPEALRPDLPDPQAPVSEPPPQGPVALEKLLRLGPGPAEPDPVARMLEAPDDATPDERAERRLRLEHRRDASEHGSERQLEDELGVSLPLDGGDSLRLRGGVRIDREKSARGEDDLEAGPAIGLEKRF